MNATEQHCFDQWQDMTEVFVQRYGVAVPAGLRVSMVFEPCEDETSRTRCQLHLTDETQADSTESHILFWEQQRPIPMTNTKRTRLFGELLAALMDRRGVSRSQLAAAIHADEELVAVLLDGLLPLEEIDPDLVYDLSAALDIQPVFLSLVLGRYHVSTATNADQRWDAVLEEIILNSALINPES